MRKILIIEDDVLVRDSVSASLESVGYEVMEAATCHEGLQNHQQFGASVIISDVVSLEEKGGESLRRLCQQSPDIPLITLTGTMGAKSGVRSTRCMSTHTLQKPFTLDELLATVQSALTVQTALAS